MSAKIVATFMGIGWALTVLVFSVYLVQQSDLFNSEAAMAEEISDQNAYSWSKESDPYWDQYNY